MSSMFSNRGCRSNFVMLCCRLFGPVFFVLSVVVLVSYFAAVYVMAAEKRVSSEARNGEKCCNGKKF